eukprot:CAMPEP_0202734808 /NCGR_PEP_ID=MMETSP1385-20130828/188878_1 /ASSEMBLY_ACC=CAM_ASM_000861 /TAXON_ID=933848 /ORGANISM="Elphidium margaritaceum" /LENGTH=88 /DNA_ID=CAMNT_0049401191 /DNA_START=695 /DNA_END=958 /DNA_ORIENTATION=-
MFDAECHVHEMLNKWLRSLGCDTVPDGCEIDELDLAEISGLSEDYFCDLKRDIMREYIHYNKVQQAMENTKTAALLKQLHRKIEWNEE